jgi:hypothetical protein
MSKKSLCDLKNSTWQSATIECFAIVLDIGVYLLKVLVFRRGACLNRSEIKMVLELIVLILPLQHFLIYVPSDYELTKELNWLFDLFGLFVIGHFHLRWRFVTAVKARPSESRYGPSVVSLYKDTRLCIHG